MISIIIFTDIYPEEYPDVFWHVAVDGKIKDEDIEKVRKLVKQHTSENEDVSESDIHEFVTIQIENCGYKIVKAIVYDLECFDKMGVW